MTQGAPSLRERTREAVRSEIRRQALALFVAQGFDETKTDDIARAAGISPRSFFRYFATKEDVLVGESLSLGDVVAAAFAERPLEEDVWTSLRHCLEPVVARFREDPRYALDLMTVVMSTASLRAHHFEKHLAWERLLVPRALERLGDDLMRAEVLAHAALACLDVALSHWVDSGGTQDFGDLLDASFGQIGTTDGP